MRRDGDDPYLVVAADKGTGAFSDVANELAAERGYWLGDAFASGGSAGFDHKEMGITSRGAWISVQAHFRALGVDADTAPLTVVGIGDMSGDVFGNGLLRSPHAEAGRRLRPPPRVRRSRSRSGGELRRTAAPVRAAGVVVGRLRPRGALTRWRASWRGSAKSVDALTRSAASCSGVDDRPLTPDELVSAVLRAPVDLLWNGGIGTFVKATTESTVDVGDRTNDAVRIDATELRCRVVAEGGNLGFTQRARVEFALAGGRINTDAIDNSAGVDCSDHEVNIKILLQRAIAAGELDAAARDALLVRMTDAVADLVLADNEAQANALGIAVGRGARSWWACTPGRWSGSSSRPGLDRALEALPTAKALQERHAAGRRAHVTRARGAAGVHQARAAARAGRVRRARRSRTSHDALRRVLPARPARRLRRSR